MKTFREHLTDTLTHTNLLNLAQHGADGGYPGLTRTAELAELYEEYKEEIWAAANDDAVKFRHDNTMAFISTFNVWVNWDIREDEFATGMVWYMAEREASLYADEYMNNEETE